VRLFGGNQPEDEGKNVRGGKTENWKEIEINGLRDENGAAWDARILGRQLPFKTEYHANRTTKLDGANGANLRVQMRSLLEGEI